MDIKGGERVVLKARQKTTVGRLEIKKSNGARRSGGIEALGNPFKGSREKGTTRCIALQRVALHCVAVRCSALQCVAMRCSNAAVCCRRVATPRTGGRAREKEEIKSAVGGGRIKREVAEENDRGRWEFNLVSECTRPRYKYFYLSEREVCAPCACVSAEISL